MMTTATRKLPPRNEWVPRVFRRQGTFYVVDLPADEDLNLHAELNPGTLRIEDAVGNQLWPAPPAPLISGAQGLAS